MIVSVNTYFTKNDSIGLENYSFNAFVDYDAQNDFNSMEESLIESLNYQINNQRLFLEKLLEFSGNYN